MEVTLTIDKLNPPTGKGKPIILVACGCFNPIQFMHLRVLEMAKDWSVRNGFDVLGGYISPAGDGYKKEGLLKASHRVAMIEISVRDSSWIMVDSWEAKQLEYIRTLKVLDRFQDQINKVNPGVGVVLVCGADLVASFNIPGVWADEDVKDIVEKYGITVVERESEDLNAIISQNKMIKDSRENIHIITPDIQNDLSSWSKL